MRVKEINVLRGPNYWSIKRQKLIQLTIDLEELEHRPTDRIPGFLERLQQLLPSLRDHRCSVGEPGGFFERVRRGTWMGHVIEHIALELQTLAGIEVGFGQTRGTGVEGVYHMAFEYGEEEEGRYAADAAIRVAEALIAGEPYDVQKDVDEIRRLWHKERLGPSTGSIAGEAGKRGIPVMRLDNNSLVQLGYGCQQKRIEATITSQTNSLAVDLACDKARTKQLLIDAHVPVPQGEVIDDEGELAETIEAIGYPIVIKPLNGNHGNGATINIRDWAHAECAFRRAKKYCDQVIVEKFISGCDFRVLVINNQFAAAACRTPACVKGDGVHTIRELIERENRNPRRGNGHENVLTEIIADEVTIELLQKCNYTLDSILPMDKKLPLKPTANLSTGGTAKDVTDEVHPQNRLLFERIARNIGLDICGIDVMAQDLSTPLKENGGAVLEVNAAPGFRMHLEPTEGKPRNVAKPVVDMLFPGKNNGRIPIVAITGTNGKTTTTRLVAHMVKSAGYVTGFTSTDGVYIHDELVLKGDCSGPGSAQMVLKDKAVEFAVLETARGGILRSGLGYDQCDCAVVTNVAEDHLGLGGINTLEKLARVKSVVPESVHANGYAVLNADDDLVFQMRENVNGKVALFSLFTDNIRVEEHCAAGGLAAVYDNGYLLLRIGNHFIPVEEVANIPITFGGRAEFNIANALAATLAAYTSKIKLSVIREALRSFLPSNENTPGRINIYEFEEFTVLLDYAHNPHGVRALGKFVKTFDATTKIGLITGVGDRRNEDIIALGEEAAKVFDEIIIRHDSDMRGRSHEELEGLLTTGIRRVDPAIPISCFGQECEALEKAMALCKPRSLLVVLVENVQAMTAFLLRMQKDHQKELMSLQKAV
ncbi:cyanophycin synthetase [Flavisolibacter nicotianae]|uniref:cyanophycin synthetase n=1 Tax=Flavisolibacter nicotianae TaxID=2364882 RepID=UPI000EAB9530|nr:cyanophycin synthetase [Flavisolibacter nicotianae]